VGNQIESKRKVDKIDLEIFLRSMAFICYRSIAFASEMQNFNH